ncbi:hypothetical protein MMC12_005696 [Toensbergia leucococca]|nr:hypothetical protein [Toensbergia leucococca]
MLSVLVGSITDQNAAATLLDAPVAVPKPIASSDQVSSTVPLEVPSTATALAASVFNTLSDISDSSAAPKSSTPPIVQTDQQSLSNLDSTFLNQLTSSQVPSSQQFVPMTSIAVVESTTVLSVATSTASEAPPAGAIGSGSGSDVSVPPNPVYAQQSVEVVGSAQGVAIATVGDQTVSILPSGTVAAGGTIITPGASSIMIANTPVSVGSTVVVVGDSTIALSIKTPAATPALASVGVQQIQPASNGGVIIGESTLLAGAFTTVGNTQVSVGAGNVVFDSSTVAIPVPEITATIPLPSVGGQQIQPLPGGGLIIGGTSLLPGVQTTIGSVGVSVGSGSIIVGSSTLALSASSSAIATLPSIVGQQIQLALDGGVIIGGNTLPPGAQTSVGGTLVSIGTNNVIIGSKTYAVPTPGATAATPLPLVGGESLQVAPNGGILIGGSTISPGAQVTVSGTPIAVGINNVVVGGSTYALPSPAISAATAIPPTVGGEQISPGLNGAIVAGQSTISPGNEALISGTPVSVGTGKVVIAGNTYPMPFSSTSALQVIAGQQIQTAANGNIIFPGSTTLSAGGPAATIAGSVVSVLPSGLGLLVLGTVPSSAAAFTTIGGEQIQTAANGAIVLPGSTTLSAGGAAATISGTVVSVLPSGNGLLVGGTTYAIPSSASPFITVDGQQIQTAANGAVILSGQTLTAGGPAATISGTVISVLPSGAGLLVGSSTYAIPSSAPGFTTFDGQAIQTAANGNIILSSTTLSAGGPAATISGIPLSVLPNGAGLLISTSTVSLPTSSIPQSIFTVAGDTFTAAPTGFVINGTALSSDGSAIAVSGTVISLGPSGLRIGSTTVPLIASATRSVSLVSGMITSSLGTGRSSSTGSPVAKATTVHHSGVGRIGVEWLGVVLFGTWLGLGSMLFGLGL